MNERSSAAPVEASDEQPTFNYFLSARWIPKAKAKIMAEYGMEPDTELTPQHSVKFGLEEPSAGIDTGPP